VETLLEKDLRSRPPFVEESIKDMPRERGPDVLAHLPSILLEIRAKLRVPEPEDSEVRLVCERMLRESDSLEVLGVEPIHMCMGIARITRPSVDFTSVNGPEI